METKSIDTHPKIKEFAVQAKTEICVDKVLREFNRHGELLRIHLNSYRELSMLYEIAAGFHQDEDTAGHCLEFGTFRGGSAVIMGLALREYHKEIPLFTIDSYHTDVNHINSLIAQQVFSRFDLKDFICPIIYPDLEALSLLAPPFRLIFLDSDHSYTQKTRAISVAMERLVTDGWLLIHDYHAGCRGTVNAVNEFLDSQDLYDIEVFRITGTIGIHLLGKR